MKLNCEGCGVPLSPDKEAYVCSYECTFCLTCFYRQKNCPHCGGELVRRPRRNPLSSGKNARPLPSSRQIPGGWLLWIISFCVWGFISLAGTFTVWQLYRSTDDPMRFTTTLGLELSQVLTYFPLTPLVFVFAIRFPIRACNWKRRIPLYFVAGLLFCLGHITLRGLTPFGIYEPKYHDWTSVVWDSHLHAFFIRWSAFRKLFFNNVVDDITGTFVPIILIAHAISYYRKFRDREIRATQLEGQLAKAHLQSLKSQLQPHFLFNTMHSISALMLTDVQAADRMIARLADLLRMNLESAGTQITTLNHELEFVHCYLEIEQVRFEERLSLKFEIAPETLDAQVPILLLQPLVDNAVKHGISRLVANGEIRISAYRHNGDLKLEVRDNGPGLVDSGNDRGSRIGLRVTRERLETLYGENQSVELACPPEGGVSVLVTIPFQRSPEKLDSSSVQTDGGISVALQESA